MFQLRHQTLIIFSGLLWLIVGCFLLFLGLNLLMEAVQSKDILSYPLLSAVSGFFPQKDAVDQAAVVLTAGGLLIGFFKGRKVLAKSAARIVKRIQTFPNPTSFFNIYSFPYLLLIGLMISIGMLMRIFQVPQDIRSVVDIAVGSALIHGSLFYWKTFFLNFQSFNRT